MEEEGLTNATPDMEQILKDAVASMSDKYDADVIAYSGNLFPPNDRRFVHLCRSRAKKKKNVLLILTTPGGLADSAYRIAHCLQRTYKTSEDSGGEFILYAPEYCKSGGTILALGADRIILSQTAELGPIDVQLRKEEEVGDWTSGLNAVEALETLREQALQFFLQCFKELRFNRELGFSTKVATEVATKMASNLLQPIYSQIDPMRLGELERFVRISIEYGERLATKNVKKGTIEKLVVGYPSHGFIIDRAEARRLFERVEIPPDELEAVGEIVLRQAIEASVFDGEKAKPKMVYLNEESPADEPRSNAKPRTIRNRKASSSGTSKAKRKGVPASRGTGTGEQKTRANGPDARR